MTPFLQFRVWLRRGPSGERVTAGFAALIVVALVAWAAIPVDRAGGRSSVGVGVGADVGLGREVGPGEGSAAFAPVEGALEEGGGGRVTAVARRGEAATGSAATAADRCAGLGATAQGVSSSEIFIAFSYIKLASGLGNTTFRVRDDVEAVVAAVVAGINDEGGVACRKLRIKTYSVDPLNPEEQRARCLEMIGDKPFAVIDLTGFATPAARSCFVEAKIPYQGNYELNDDEAEGAFPYLHSITASSDREMRNWVFEAAARRWFDPQNGFGKLGLILDECNPTATDELIKNLANLGVSRSVFTSSGCASVIPPNEISQAVVQHRNDDVSHVYLGVSGANAQNYVRSADGISWKPVYMVSDYGGNTAVNIAPLWPNGFDGATAVTSRRYGERDSGIVHPLVARCNEWLQKRNVPPDSASDQIPGTMCDMFRLFRAAGDAVGPNLVQRALVANGLPKVGGYETSLMGDAIFDRQRKVSGGDFVRAIRWRLDCTCWKVLDPAMKPSPSP